MCFQPQSFGDLMDNLPEISQQCLDGQLTMAAKEI